MAIIGIDLGTTNSLATIWKSGQAVVIRNSLGDVLTPSVVGVDDNGEILVGKVAAERLVSAPDKTAAEFKRQMGTSAKINLGGKSFSPEQLSSLVLKKIKQDAEAFLGEEIEEAIISVPAYFDDKRRSATKAAAEMSGLKVERLINEPSAAALAYLQKNGYKDGTYMVVDFGGGTLDVSIIDSFDSVMEILAVAGDNQLGGKDFNEAIYKEFISKNELIEDTLTPEEKAAIYRTAEACKIALTTMPMSFMNVVVNNKSYSLTLDNNSLIKIASNVFERVERPIKKVLRDARIKMDELEAIILVGGSCKMPTVAAFIENITGTKVTRDINPDTAIAVGAGIFAGMKSRNEEFKDIIMTDICPFSLGVACQDYRTNEMFMDFVIQRNSMLPCSREHTYYAVGNNQTRFLIRIYQGESVVPEANILLGTLDIQCPPTAIHEPLAKTRLTYDINGILMIDVETMDGRKSSKVIMSDSGRLSDAEIERLKEKMESLKLSPADREESRLLIARAERVIEETLNSERTNIVNVLMNYKYALQEGRERDVRSAYEKLKEVLDNTENF